MRTLGVAAPFAAGLAVLASSWAPSSTPLAMKCGVSADQALVAFDGKVVGPTAGRRVTLNEIDRERIFSVEIACMDPVDSTFSRNPGIPVISIWTRDGPRPQMEPLLAHILEFQSSHHQWYGGYAEDLGALDVTEFLSAIDVTLHVNDDGWMAVASVTNLLAKCVVFDGLWPSPHHTSAAGEPTCLSRHQVEEAGTLLALSEAREHRQ